MQLDLLLTSEKDAPLLADAEFMTASLYAMLENHADEMVVNALKILAKAHDASHVITELLPSLSDEQTENLITAVGMFAQVLNIAEDVHHERRRLAHEHAGSAASDGSFVASVNAISGAKYFINPITKRVKQHPSQSSDDGAPNRSATPSHVDFAPQNSRPVATP